MYIIIFLCVKSTMSILRSTIYRFIEMQICINNLHSKIYKKIIYCSNKCFTIYVICDLQYNFYNVLIFLSKNRKTFSSNIYNLYFTIYNLRNTLSAIFTLKFKNIISEM